MNKTKQKRCWRRVGALVALLITLLATDYLAYPYGSHIGGRSFNQRQNGLWLRYWWYFGERSEKEVRELADRLRQRQIRYAYFHVRFVTSAGTLRFRYPDAARQLVRSLHLRAPSVKVIAWVYVGNSRAAIGKLGQVDLQRAEVRKRMVAEALWLVNECGFDGVQWDYEVCSDGDSGFLSLMRETRAALPEGKWLSTATPMWVPPRFREWGWSEGYFSRVAATCDDVAVMCYDSACYLPRAYVWLVRQQAVYVTRAVARGNPRCRVLFGVPTYHEGGATHHPQAENLWLALKGVREGLSNWRADLSVFAGVALFADYTTQPEEWRMYEKLWLEK